MKPNGKIVGTFHEVTTYSDRMTLPPYVDITSSIQRREDTLAVHAQRLLNESH